MTAAESNDTMTDQNFTATSTESDKLAVTENDDLVELQKKITKEILSSKLEEKEMQELQVYSAFALMHI